MSLEPSLPRVIYGGQVGTIYDMPTDRYIVSLIVGYSRDDLKNDPAITIDGHMPRTPLDFARVAAAAALDLTRDDGASGTNWVVYDRHLDRWYVFEQFEFEEASNA